MMFGKKSADQLAASLGLRLLQIVLAGQQIATALFSLTRSVWRA